MNERIKELAHVLPFEWIEKSPDNIEKFAELIVRECADVGSKCSLAHPEAIRYQIKKHFGVKE